ncbi:MAG: NAD-dependent epimerase/dehydratase family protein [Planctomycetota bacterium]|jgi:UDP-glucose 4-epimerase
MLTGVAGFIGRTMASQMLRHGNTIAGIDTCSPENSGLQGVGEYRQLPLPSQNFGEFLAEFQPNFLVHCAGRSSVPLSMTDPSGDFEQGPQVTLSILDQVMRNSPKTKLLFCSSAAVYGEPTELPISEATPIRPISPYGFHKRISEMLCEQYFTCFGVQSATMRIFSAYGPGLRRQVVYEICQQSLNHYISLQGTGEETRDFIHVQDIARAALKIIERADFECEVFNVASGRETSIRELALLASKLVEPCPKIDFRSQRLPGMPQRWVADISRLKSLGFEPTIEIGHGIKSVVDWCRLESPN